MAKKKIKKQPYLPKDGSEDPHPLLIPLQNFDLRHDTFQKEEELAKDFVGRTNLIKQLSKLLETTTGKRGSYLIAGFRGAGKTSLINRVLDIYKNNKNNKEKLIIAEINLGHDSVLDTRHVLYNIISVLNREFKNKHGAQLNWVSKLVCIPLIIIFTCFTILSLYFWFQFFEQAQFSTLNNICLAVDSYINSNPDLAARSLLKNGHSQFHDFLDSCSHLSKPNEASSFQNFSFNEISLWPKSIFSYFNEKISIPLVSVSILLLIYVISCILRLPIFKNKFLLNIYLFFIFRGSRKDIAKLNRQIQNLYNSVAYSFEKNIGALSPRYTGFGFFHKTKIPEMKEPQIELELINILALCQEKGFDIIFVFDELDKISLTVTESNDVHHSSLEHKDFSENETVDENVYRRKKRIDSLLASLKTLITVGKARFFFIAGRDMLDSYQSEKGSTSSLYESLFNQVFEVPSFLTDDSDQKKTRLHSMIEVYVCHRLLPENIAEKYWIANVLCGKVMNDEQLLQEIEALINENDHLQYSRVIGLFQSIILNNIDSNWKVFIYIHLYNLKFKINNLIIKIFNLIFKIKNKHRFYEKINNFESLYKNESKENKLNTHIAFFVRDMLLEYLSSPEIRFFVIHKLEDTKKEYEDSENKYSKKRLNIYYLYLCHESIASPSDVKNVLFTLNQFINYLTIHSWGNSKRLASLFESFTKPMTMSGSISNAMNWLPDDGLADYMLHFGVTERQRISMGSNLYIMFNQHLNRQFTGADKLVVSTMAALHYCMKFHRTAFSRHHLFRMTEMMSSYSSPELNSLFETTLTQVLWPYLRQIRNGMLQYRFFTWIEQEIRYITRVDDLESASYTFSLDAINNIKTHYRKTLENVMATYKTIEACSQERGPGLIAEINIVLGDIYLVERAYDESVIYFQTAVNAHHNLDKEKKYHLECLLRFVEALLKLGNVQEYRQRYDRAAMNYYQAKQLVDDFLEYKGKSLPSFLEMTKKNEDLTICEFLVNGDSKWNILKQPYWALLYLNIKSKQNNQLEINIPETLYGVKEKQDPYGEYRKGQLCFYLGRYEEAKEAFIKVIGLHKTSIINKQDFYLTPTACINLAENELARRMKNLSMLIDLEETIKTAKENKSLVTEEYWKILRTMQGVKCFSDLETSPAEVPFFLKKNNQFSMKAILGLIFYAAKEYEDIKQYDHAAMAYLKAISLWMVAIDMLVPIARNCNHKDKFKKIVSNMFIENSWFAEASKRALLVIRHSNGQAQPQARKKWHLRDLADYPNKENYFDIETMGYKEITKLHTAKEREKLKDNFTFLQGSYLGQQLLAMNNWAFTIKRTLLKKEPCPLKSYRIPVYTTRSLILYSWINGREYLEQAKIIYLAIHSYNCNFLNRYTSTLKCCKIYNDLKIQYKQANKPPTSLTSEDCYYIISAKGIHNFYTALYYMRILTDNNQTVIIPPPTFVILHLWRLVYGLVKYEKNKQNNIGYDQSRFKVRAKLMKYISKETPSSHLDLDYLAQAVIRQLQTIINMGTHSSSSRMNILQNKYYLHDDYEDPGFHLDWTVVQMLSPSAMVSIKWINEEMEKIKKKSTI